jgi:hypothetical protein
MYVVLFSSLLHLHVQCVITSVPNPLPETRMHRSAGMLISGCMMRRTLLVADCKTLKTSVPEESELCQQVLKYATKNFLVEQNAQLEAADGYGSHRPQTCPQEGERSHRRSMPRTLFINFVTDFHHNARYAPTPHLQCKCVF